MAVVMVVVVRATVARVMEVITEARAAAAPGKLRLSHRRR